MKEIVGDEVDLSKDLANIGGWSDSATKAAHHAHHVEDWFQFGKEDIPNWSLDVGDLGEWNSGAVIDVSHWSINTA